MNASRESCPICGAPAHNEDTDERYCKHAVLSGYIGEVDDENAMEWLPGAPDNDALKVRLMKASEDVTGGLFSLVELIDDLPEEVIESESFWQSIESRLGTTLVEAISQKVYREEGQADRHAYTFAVLDADPQAVGDVLFESEGFGLGWAWRVFFSQDARQAGEQLLDVLESDRQCLTETIQRLTGDTNKSA